MSIDVSVSEASPGLPCCTGVRGRFGYKDLRESDRPDSTKPRRAWGIIWPSPARSGRIVSVSRKLCLPRRDCRLCTTEVGVQEARIVKSVYSCFLVLFSAFVSHRCSSLSMSCFQKHFCDVGAQAGLHRATSLDAGTENLEQGLGGRQHTLGSPPMR